MSASVALCLAVSVLMIAQPVALLATDMTLRSGLSRAGKVRSSCCCSLEQACMVVTVIKPPRMAGCGMQEMCCIHSGLCVKVFMLSCIRAAVLPGRCLESCSLSQ